MTQTRDNRAEVKHAVFVEHPLMGGNCWAYDSDPAAPRKHRRTDTRGVGRISADATRKAHRRAPLPRESGASAPTRPKKQPEHQTAMFESSVDQISECGKTTSRPTR
ncbi:unnamed protein product [Linum trigynum]|uniref:Uncharacterized protein n=1 Tax=Linum trigynum TaxID=586398 RepID=A0AAV2EX71_9ROSI